MIREFTRIYTNHFIREDSCKFVEKNKAPRSNERGAFAYRVD